MLNPTTEKWSIKLGRWRSIDLRLHIQLPLLALVSLLAGIAPRYGVVETRVTLWALAVLTLSVVIHELVRVATAFRVGGHASSLVIGPMGGWSKLMLPDDPPAHLIPALVGPMTFFVLMVSAGCGLALAGDHQFHLLMLNPVSPPINLGAEVSTFYTIAQLTLWINWCLLLISLLPIDPCSGAELLRGVLWPIVGRTSASVATSHVALASSAIMALISVLLLQQDASSEILANQELVSGPLMPAWFPPAVLAVFLLYGGRRNPYSRHYDIGLAIDEFDSDDEEWIANEWSEDDREAVLVEHLIDQKQEVLDRKRREREANEDERVDDILIRLRDSSFEQLSEEERAILKRASRRYRQRREQADSDE